MKGFLATVILILSACAADACRLALVLAIDISNSVDGAEFEIQRDGLHDALLDHDVRQGLVRAQAMVTVVFWSGARAQYVVVPWRRMARDQDVQNMAEEVIGLHRVYFQSNTALGGALAFSASLFGEVPQCARRTIDVSGDGPDNASSAPSDERDAAARQGVTVNGLAIEGDTFDLTQYFRQHVITPDGFVMTARGHRSYSETLKRKMRREVSEAMM